MSFSLFSRIFTKDALLVMSALGAGVGGAVWSGHEIDEVAEKKIAPVKMRVEALEASVAIVEMKIDRNEERSARRFEVLYDTVLQRKPQPGAEELRPKVTP